MRRNVIALVLVCIMVLGMVPNVFAEEYTYTVRFYAGKQGSFGGSEVVTYAGLKEGAQVNFHAGAVTVSDPEKYYVKGIRLSGMDNNTVAASSFTVTKDMDFVVAYGVWSKAVSYTIHYVDENGTPLADSETYYGNVGDKPVVGYLYIEGYQPRYYNITGTLRENPEDNNWTFVYAIQQEAAPSPVPESTNSPSPEPSGSPTPAPSPEQSEEPESEPGEGEGTDAITNGAEATATDEEGMSPEAENGVDDEQINASDETTNPATISDETDDSADTTQDILDMDVPLAEYSEENSASDIVIGSQNTASTRRPIKYIVSAGVMGVVVLLGIGIVVAKRRKKKQ